MTEYLLRVWQSRQTLQFLFFREFRARYRHTHLGYLWAILQPFSLMVVLTTVFSLVTIVKVDLPYPVLVFLNLSIWTFLAGCVTTCANSLISNGALVKRIYFPRALLPASIVLGQSVDFGIALLGVACLMAVFGVTLPPTAPLLLLAFVWQASLCLCLGMGLAMLTVYFRDVRHIIAVVMQVWLFASPVIYPLSMVPAQYRPYYMINPMAGVLALYDDALLRGNPGNWQELLISLTSTLIIGVVSVRYFIRHDRNCGDLV